MPLPTPPTLLLAAGGIALVWGHFHKVHPRFAWGGFSLAAVLIAVACLWFDPVTTTEQSESIHRHRVWINDPLAVSEQGLVLAFGLLAGFALLDRSTFSPNEANDHGFFLFSLAGLMLIARSNDFLSLGLSLEITGAAGLAFRRLNRLATVTATTVTGATGEPMTEIRSPSAGGTFSGNQSELHWLTSIGLWLGIALLMNTLATTEFDAIKRILVVAYQPQSAEASIGAPSKLILLAAGLIVLSLYGRMGVIALLDNDAPGSDITPRPLCGFILLSGPLAGGIALTRLCGVVFEGLGDSLTILLIVLCLVAFLRSAVMAVRGFNAGSRSIPVWVRSLVIAQSAWLGIGLIAVAMELQHPDARWAKFPTEPETLSLLVYAQVVQLVACGGVIWTLEFLSRAGRGVEYLEDLKGLARFAVIPAIVLMASIISCAGGPWTAGFWGRWWMIVVSLNVHIKTLSSILVPHGSLRILIFLGIIASIPIAGIAIRFFRELFLEQPLARTRFTGGRGALVAGILAALTTLILGVAPQLLVAPLRAIQAPQELLPETQPRGSGKNHSVFRMNGPGPEKFAGLACQDRSARQVRHELLISIKVAACSWQSPQSWAQFCPVWSGTLELDHHPSEDIPFILVDPNS
ncbi:hypothetical protein [Schlesneria sp.]|uniref:hypothetical protein n=1 Tax=Schlesneria sp. TaxID=2762018 RepID=UPI002F036878